MPGDDLYWSPIEPESDESFNEKEPYIDPWDLENYAYIRNHLDYTELSSSPSIPSATSGDFTEAPSHSFQYVPAFERPVQQLPTVKLRRGYDCWTNDQENYAAIDEIHQLYDRRARSDMYVPMSRRKIMDEYESDPEEISPYAEGTVRGNSVFGIYDEKGIFRKVALPIPTTRGSVRDRSLSFSYGDYEHDSYNINQKETMELDSFLPEMESIQTIRQRRHSYKPDNFGLSKQGHLKIDYSYSWNNLNRYIKYN